MRHVLVYIFKTDPACLDINKDLKCFVAEKDCLERFDLYFIEQNKKLNVPIFKTTFEHLKLFKQQSTKRKAYKKQPNLS